jgi:hypothetical protein
MTDYLSTPNPSGEPLYYLPSACMVNMGGNSVMSPQIGVSMPAYLTGGYVPKCRHVYLHYRISSGAVPTSVDIYNGPTKVFTKTYAGLTWPQNTVFLDDIVMDKYYVFNRGFHMTINLQNYDDSHIRVVELYGAGVRMEW